MGALKLRRFPPADARRLGELLARARQGAVSDAEADELATLIARAISVSNANARALARLNQAKRS